MSRDNTGRRDYIMEMQTVDRKDVKDANSNKKNGAHEPMLKSVRLKEGSKIFQCLSALIGKW